MKQKDLVLILVVVFFSGILSLVVSRMIIASPDNLQQEVEIVQPITAKFENPDDRFFNRQSYDPTQLITIGQDQNSNPFSANSN
jgi:hypothetical protein